MYQSQGQSAERESYLPSTRPRSTNDYDTLGVPDNQVRGRPIAGCTYDDMDLRAREHTTTISTIVPISHPGLDLPILITVGVTGCRREII